MSVLRLIAVALAIASAVAALDTSPERASVSSSDRVVIIDESISCDDWLERDAVRAEAESAGVRVVTIGGDQPFKSPVVATMEGVFSAGEGELLLVTDGIDTTGRSLDELAGAVGGHRVHALRPREPESNSPAFTLDVAPVTTVVGPRDPLEIEAVLRNPDNRPVSVRLQATPIGLGDAGSVARRALVPARGMTRATMSLRNNASAEAGSIAVDVLAEAGNEAARGLARFGVIPSRRVLVLGGRLTPGRAASARAIAELPGLMTEALWRVGEATRSVRALPVGVTSLTGAEPRDVASRFAACVVLDGESVVRDRALSPWLEAVVVAGVPVIDAAEVGPRGAALTPEARAERIAVWASVLGEHTGNGVRPNVFFDPVNALPGEPVLVRSNVGDAVVVVLKPSGSETELGRVEATPRGVSWTPPGPGTYVARVARAPGEAGSVLLVRESRSEVLDRVPRVSQLSRFTEASGGAMMDLDDARAWLRAAVPSAVPDRAGARASLHRWLASGALLCAFASWLAGLRREGTR